jgi:hypothetical protein
VDRGVPFGLRARQCYGAALERIRETAGDEQRFVSDSGLVALLLLDQFEVSVSLRLRWRFDRLMTFSSRFTLVARSHFAIIKKEYSMYYVLADQCFFTIRVILGFGKQPHGACSLDSSLPT